MGQATSLVPVLVRFATQSWAPSLIAGFFNSRHFFNSRGGYAHTRATSPSTHACVGRARWRRHRQGSGGPGARRRLRHTRGACALSRQGTLWGLRLRPCSISTGFHRVFTGPYRVSSGLFWFFTGLAAFPDASRRKPQLNP